MQDIVKHEFKIENNINEIIKGDIRLPKGRGRHPVVIIMHGFKAYKDWGFFPYISSKIASAGAISACFNFSLNGISDEDSEIFDVEKFSVNTVSQELADALLILKKIEDYSLLDDFGIADRFNGEIYLLGHSLGGAIAILTTKQWNEKIESEQIGNHDEIGIKNLEFRISKLALWATISHFDRYTKHQKRQWHSQGFMEFTNNSTGQLLRMNVSYLEDIEKNFINGKFSVTSAVNSFKFPILVVHGDKDVTVPFKEGKEIASSIDEEFLKFYKIEKAGHIFGVEHHMKFATAGLKKTLDITLDFFGL